MVQGSRSDDSALDVEAEGVEGPGGVDDVGAVTWRVLLDAQLRLEDAATALRQNLMVTAAVLALATLIVERFLFLTTPELALVSLLPILLVAAGGLIDVFWYDARVRAVGDEIHRLEARANHADALSRARSEATGRRFSRRGVVGYWLVPLLVLLALFVWRFL